MLHSNGTAPLLGFAHIQLLRDQQGEVEDYRFLEVDAAFEALTGWDRTQMIGRRASRLFPNGPEINGYWLSYYTRVVQGGKAQEVTHWMGIRQHYVTMVVIPLNQNFFSIAVRKSDEATLSPTQEKEGIQALDALEPVFSNTRDAIALLEYANGEFYYVRTNSAHQRRMGYTSIRGLELSLVVGEETAQEVRRHFQACIDTGRPVSYEWTFQGATGQWTWQTEVTPIFSRGGVRYLLLFSNDATEMRQMRRDHEKMVRRHQAMFEQHSAMMAVFEPGTGRIIDVNPSFCRFYGYSRAEMLAMNIQDINIFPVDMQGEDAQSAQDGGSLFPAVPHRIKSGELRLLDIYSSFIWDGERRMRYSIVFDVTEREVLREQLAQEKELLRTTLRSIGDGVVTTDNDGNITSLNPVAEEVLGQSLAQVRGRPFEEVFVLRSEQTGRLAKSPIRQVLDTGRVVGLANHTELVTHLGRHTPIADSAAPIRGEDGKSQGVVMVFRDVSAEKEHNRQIQYLSYHDALTGLYNRRYIEEAAPRLEEDDQLPLTVVMGDVNGLKLTNDVFGHKAGDALLQSVAELLTRHSREHDLVARWGGDEFVMFLPRTGLAEAEALVEQIKGTHVTIQSSGLALSLSLGCGTKESPAGSIQVAMRTAEESMYHQKLLEGKSYRSALIDTLLATLYQKSDKTEEHAKRIERYCHIIGRELHLSAKEMDELALLALLHDIGKVSINPDILLKPGPLTPEEWEEMQRHPEAGYRIAHAAPELSAVADLILAHHERWDGTGYPQGLKGLEIPLACRILAVADTFDAIINNREYRDAQSIPRALQEIEGGIGTQFDPEIARLFIHAIQARTMGRPQQ